MEIIKFEIKNSLRNASFLTNEKIEPLYFELAEYVLITLYKIYPFSSAYEGYSSEDPNVQFQQTVLFWADTFMDKKITSKEKLTAAIRQIIDAGLDYPPSLPQVINAYFGRKVTSFEEKILDSMYSQFENAQFELDED
ncbi:MULTISPECIES: hypothetical protein [Legionella]|uniref:hypothetical protein n=1 Tax=Legionella TaxID=445 RepID=UPI00104182D9|nr:MULTISPECIES: hypothetical protein [Legionella]